MNTLEAIGRGWMEGLKNFHDTLSVLGETVCEALALPFHPGRFRFRDFLVAYQRAAFDGLPICTGIGFLLGLILAFESAAALQTFGVESYVANLLAIGLFRELGPLVTAIVLAGRSGSAFAAELGTMKVDEEIDALTTMGLPPVRFLVLPRTFAAVMAMPVLTIFVELAGLVGGAIVLKMMDIPGAVYWENVAETTDVFMIVFGLAKSAFFGLLVGLVGCCAGMRTKATADGVGVAATSAVVGGIVAVAVSDGIIAFICYSWGI
jgi:phospholipid/cholesterol/gamma-HCH transport system permease protein